MKSIPPIPSHRQCRWCQETKPLDDFCFDRKGRYQKAWQCRACKIAYQRAYNNENRDKIREYDAQRTPEQRARKNAKLRDKHRFDGENKRIKAMEYARKNADRYRENSRIWRKNNADRARALHNTYRTRKAGNGGYFTAKDIANMRYIQQGHCCYCGRLGQKLTLDHILPVTQGGPSDPWNLALACSKCNSSKHDRTPEQWVNRWYLRLEE